MNKKITTDALQLALILTLLSSGSYYCPPYYDSDYDDIPGYDYEPPDLISEYNSSWGSTYYSQTRAYRRNIPEYDPVSPYLTNKGLLLIDPEPFPLTRTRTGPNSSDQASLLPFLPIHDDEDPEPSTLDPWTYYHERILEELRKLKYNSQSTDSAKGPHHGAHLPIPNHNLTAYILSNTTELANSLNNGFTTLRLSGVDIGGVEQDQEQIIQTHQQQQQQQSSIPSFESLRIIEDTDIPDEPNPQLIVDVDHEIGSLYDNGPGLENFLVTTPFKVDSVPEPLIPFENSYNEHEQGAPALPESWISPSSSSDSFGLSSEDYSEEWLEASFLQFEKQPELSSLYTFDNATDEELRNVISPLALHRFDDFEIKKEDPEQDEAESALLAELIAFESIEFMKKEIKEENDEHEEEKELSGTSNPFSNLQTNTTTELEIRRRGISSSAGSISSHDEPATSHKDDEDDEDENPIDEVSSVFGSVLVGNDDDLWETDSGIFDFLDSPPPPPQSSVGEKEDEIDDADLLDELIENNFDGELEDSNSNSISTSDEMLQTAPIHPAVRPTSHSAQPRGFQVHARMPGILRSGSMNQSWQEIASLLSFQPTHGDQHVGIPGSLPHHHHPYHHHHPFVHPHHPIHHHSPFSTPGHHPPPLSPYNSDTSRVLLQNATIPPPELTNSSLPYSSVGMGPTPNLGSAVASSMHLTNNTDPMSDPGSHYNKMLESQHDMLYYQNSSTHPTATTTEINSQGTEGFFSSILNEEDLQIMDMAMNEGMCTMRTLDYSAPNGTVGGSHESSLSTLGGPVVPLPATGGTTNEDRLEASSDSAVSSMGSERIPMTDTDWSEPEHHPSPYSLDYANGKLGRAYEYGYGSKESSRIGGGVPVAQKKHQMFGKRFQQEQGPSVHPSSYHHPLGPYGSAGGGLLPHHSNPLEPLEMKYSCSLDFARNHDIRVSGTNGGTGELIHSNHTYALPPTHPDNPMITNLRSPRGSSGGTNSNNLSTKEKQPKMIKDFKTSSEEHLSRDEKRARSLGLPMTTDDIINLPMDEFNERLSKYDLSETQLSLIRDIRRRGKNKVAAQNCRKRKLDQILHLASEVETFREKKHKLGLETESLMNRKTHLSRKYGLLYRHVFQALRDPAGNPYSPHEYSLQMAADGNVLIVPKNGNSSSTTNGHGGNSSNSGSEPQDPLDISHYNRQRHSRSKDESSKKE